MSVRSDGSRTGLKNDENFQALCSIRQHVATGDLHVGYAFGKWVMLTKDSDDWLDMMDLLKDLSPSGSLSPNRKVQRGRVR